MKKNIEGRGSLEEKGRLCISDAREEHQGTATKDAKEQITYNELHNVGFKKLIMTNLISGACNSQCHPTPVSVALMVYVLRVEEPLLHAPHCILWEAPCNNRLQPHMLL